MAYSEAMLRAIKKYEEEKVERITLRVPKGKKEIIQKTAELCGESLNTFINRAINVALEQAYATPSILEPHRGPPQAPSPSEV